MKTCSRCLVEKPYSEYHKFCHSADGYRAECKECRKPESKRYHAENADRIAAYHAAWRVNHKDYERQRKAEWERQNLAHVRAKHRTWQRANKGKRRLELLQWRRANPAKYKAQKQLRRARIAGNGGSFTATEWLDLCRAHNNRCLCCGVAGVVLAADHIVPIAKGGTSHISNIQPLCKSCNSSKGTKIIDYRVA